MHGCLALWWLGTWWQECVAEEGMHFMAGNWVRETGSDHALSCPCRDFSPKPSFFLLNPAPWRFWCFSWTDGQASSTWAFVIEYRSRLSRTRHIQAVTQHCLAIRIPGICILGPDNISWLIYEITMMYMLCLMGKTCDATVVMNVVYYHYKPKGMLFFFLFFFFLENSIRFCK